MGYTLNVVTDNSSLSAPTSAPVAVDPMRLQVLLESVAVDPLLQLPPGVGAVALTGICNDSRRVQGGDLFLACRGGQFDGSRFIDDAIERGAVAVLCDSHYSGSASVPVIEWADLAAQQGELAQAFYRRPAAAMQMIGITGTNGKTSCSHFVAQAMSRLGQKTAVIGTTGNGFVDALQAATHTTPDAVQLQQLLAQLRDQGAVAVAMEVSSHALEQDRVAEVEFEQAVFTNLSRDHLDYHGSMQAYADAKAKLFIGSGIKRAVINTDDKFGLQLWQQLPAAIESIAIGSQPVAGARQLWIKNCQLNERGIQAKVDSPWGELQVDSPLLGQFNLYNLLSALAVLVGAGQEPQSALAALNQLQGVEGRMQAFTAADKPLVVVDYAHTPDALEKALLSLRQHCSGQLWCLFGCGGNRDPGKRPLMASIAEQHADRVLVTSDNPRSEDPDAIIEQVMQGLQSPQLAEQQRDRRVAIETMIKQASAGDVVLVAGKGHEDYQEIDGTRHPFSDIEIVNQCLALEEVDDAD